MNYQTYLKSYDWQVKRNAALKAADHRCQICNTPMWPLEVHHRTYERLGNELPGDLTVLCADCHEAVIDRMEKNPFYWLSKIGIQVEDVAHD